MKKCELCGYETDRNVGRDGINKCSCHGIPMCLKCFNQHMRGEETMGAKFNKSSGTKIAIIPEDTYDAICYGVVDLGTHTRVGKFGEKTNQELMFMFEIPELTMTYTKDDKEVTAPRVINMKVNNFMGGKAKLRQLIDAWRGKPLTDEEADNFETSKVIGHGATISVAHSADGKYANIVTISPLHKSVKLGKPYNPLINYGIEDDGFSGPEWEKLYEWVQKIIMESHEYQNQGEEQEEEADDTDEIPF